MTTKFSQKQVLFLISIALVAMTLVAYEPVRHNDFVNYDDPRYITENSYIKSGITLQTIIKAFTRPHAEMWHPLTTLSHLIDCRLFGLNPLGHHAVNVLIHIINTLLLFRLLMNMTGSTWPSAFVSAVFALHPLQVESVAWASERKAVLSGLFWFLTIAVYLWYVKKPGVLRYILVFIVYGLCIMTKPVVVTLPLVLLLLDYWPLERLGNSNSQILKPVIEKIPFLALSGFLGVITYRWQHVGGVVTGLNVVTFDERIANAVVSYIKYIFKIIWPSRLAALYPYPHIGLKTPAAISCLVIFVLLLFLILRSGRRRKYMAAGWLWFVVTLIPMIGLIQSGAQAMADRYMYISMPGLLIIVAWGARDIAAAAPAPVRDALKQPAVLASAAVLLSLAVLTRAQAGRWQNSLTLWAHALKVTENNAVAESGYADALYEAGLLSEAEAHLKNALRIDPKHSNALLGLGNLLLNQARAGEAAYYYKELIRQEKGSAATYYNLAAALGLQKKYGEALEYLTAAYKINPNLPAVRTKMGMLLLKTGKADEAVGYLNQALITDANKEDIYECLGSAYSRSARFEQALEAWTKAVELRPDNANVLNNLAWLLATGEAGVEDATKSIGFARRACELTEHKDPEYLDTLAAAYAAGDRFDDAVDTANKALEIAKAAGQESLVAEIQNKLKLYQSGKRYQQKNGH